MGWAVPKGIPDQPGMKRLAIPVGDYRLDQAEFEGRVAGGQYGPGKIAVLDRGEYLPLKWTDREIQIRLRGEKAEGLYSLKLVEFKESGDKGWLLEKQKEKAASQTVARRAERSAKSTSAAARLAPKRSRKPPRKKTAPAKLRSSGTGKRVREKKQAEPVSPSPAPRPREKPLQPTPKPSRTTKRRPAKPRRPRKKKNTLGRYKKRRSSGSSPGFTTSSSVFRWLTRW